MHNTGIIILAAGNSSRFGGIKQLATYNGKTLVKHVVDEALNANTKPVIVVTGSNTTLVSKDINPQAQIVFNEAWKDGMASGIVAGIKQILSLNYHIRYIIIAVCDQPFVTADVFNQLIKTKATSNKHIVASAYAGTIGTPVLFSKKYFNELLNLHGDEGAKKLLKIYADDVASINFPQGNIDIDTPDDYKALMNN